MYIFIALLFILTNFFEFHFITLLMIALLISLNFTNFFEFHFIILLMITFTFTNFFEFAIVLMYILINLLMIDFY